MDPIRAAALVSTDELSSRGMNYSEATTAAEEHGLDAERALYRSEYSEKGKGKMRQSDRERFSEDEEYDDDMAWEPPATEEQAQRRRESGELQYQDPEIRGFSRHSRTRSQDSAGTADSRQLRILWWRRAGVNVLFILAWYIFSTLISVYNKWMFSADHYNFPYPLFVTSIHMAVQWTLSAITMTVFKSFRTTTRPRPFDYGTKVVPCGMATGLDIGLSNLSLRTITLSFYTMCKSSSLAFVLLFAFLFKLEVPSWRLAGIIFIITSGVVLMVSTETEYNFTGMVQVLSASALGGLRWSLTQILLDKESMGMSNPIATLYWLAPIMGVTLGTCSLIFDGLGNVFGNEVFFGTFPRTMNTMGAILFPGVLAFLMNITEFGLIQRTSVVTLSVAGIFKEVAVIFLSLLIFKDDMLTPINTTGLVITIFGIALYNYLKYKQFTSGDVAHNKPGFIPLPEDSNEEDERMLDSPRARNAARVLGSTNESALSLDEFRPTYSAPLHSLGRHSSSTNSSARSSLTIPPASNPFIDSSDPSHVIHRTTTAAKVRQREEGRVEGLGERVGSGAEMEELGEREREVEGALEGGIREHREAEDWDLLGGEEEGKRK